MKWLLLLVLLVLEIRRRRLDREVATYVQQLERWQANDPQIAPLALPRVRPLQGQIVDRVTRFRRVGGAR